MPNVWVLAGRHRWTEPNINYNIQPFLISSSRNKHNRKLTYFKPIRFDRHKSFSLGFGLVSVLVQIMKRRMNEIWDQNRIESKEQVFHFWVFYIVSYALDHSWEEHVGVHHLNSLKTLVLIPADSCSITLTHWMYGCCELVSFSVLICSLILILSG